MRCWALLPARHCAGLTPDLPISRYPGWAALTVLAEATNVDLVTLAGCSPIVFVAFQRRSGGWVDAAVIDDMLSLTEALSP